MQSEKMMLNGRSVLPCGGFYDQSHDPRQQTRRRAQQKAGYKAKMHRATRAAEKRSVRQETA